MAFPYDEGLDKYATGVVTEPPQLVQEDNPALDSDDRKFFNDILRNCFSLIPENRPSARELLEAFEYRFRAIKEKSDEWDE